MHLRAVKFEGLVVDDMHVSAKELTEWVLEALKLHLECRHIEVEMMEDHEGYVEEQDAEA